MVSYLEDNPDKVLVCADYIVINVYKNKTKIHKASGEIKDVIYRNSEKTGAIGWKNQSRIL